MEVEANTCVGPLSSRSHFQQILVQLTNSKLIRNCVSSCFVDNVILALALPNFLELGFRGLLMSLPQKLPLAI